MEKLSHCLSGKMIKNMFDFLLNNPLSILTVANGGGGGYTKKKPQQKTPPKKKTTPKKLCLSITILRISLYSQHFFFFGGMGVFWSGSRR